MLDGGGVLEGNHIDIEIEVQTVADPRECELAVSESEGAGVFSDVE